MSGEQQILVSTKLLEACCVIEGAIAGFAAERASNRHLAELSVGYDSLSQFSREYRSIRGAPLARNGERLRRSNASSAK
jgi:DNA-binding FadR family transcriptional regulator